MNQTIRKTALLMGTCSILGLCYSPQVFAEKTTNVVTALQQANKQKVQGTVVDTSGPIIGASVLEKGTSNGVVTDFDGKFSLNVNPGATLVISYVGYKRQEIQVGNRSNIKVVLEESTKMLNEVVAIGYGVQKKKLVTGATVEIKGDAIQKLNTTQVLGALRSQAPGVNITAISGQPGDGFKVTIRGAGTNSDTKPIYVIDGVSGGDINNLNPADIESIDVLKDAASCAIYGSDGANGVMLITTKQGKQGKVQVTYDGNMGWSNVYKMPSLLNAKQYMEIQDQVSFNSGGSNYDWSKFISPDLLKAYQNGTNSGTNWLDAIRNKNAVSSNHSLNIIGGNDVSKFSIGAGYQYQDGIFGNMAKSDFRRFTLRLNSEHVIYRNSKGLDVVKIGENLYFQHKQNQGIQIGNQYSNVISDMLRANPCIPIYNSNGDYFMYNDLASSGSKGWFNYTSYASNPIASMMNNQSANNKSRNFNLNAIGYVEIQPIKGLIYRGQVNYSQSSWSWRAFLPVYRINDQGGSRTMDQTTQQEGLGWGWNTTNTINYKFTMARQHHFDALFGTEYGETRPNFGENLSGIATTSIYGDFSHAYLSWTKDKAAKVTGKSYDDSRSMSYFGRLNYDFKETYMLSAVFRADGSSIFAPGHRWGYFPSISAGWVISNEKFMQPLSSWVDFLKIRAGWGQNGNKNMVGNFAYQATFAYDDYSNYSFNNNKNSYTTGASPARLANPDITWETSEQTNIGFDAHLIGSHLGVTFDWYYKKTKDLLVEVPVPPTSGFRYQWKNAGTVRNTGIEIALNWNDHIGKDFTYGANWNMSVNSNKVTKINSNKKYIEGGSDLLAQGTGFMTRMEVGHPIGYFYGYKTEGVIQNNSDLAAYIAKNCDGNVKNSLQGDKLKPGDLKFVDVNGDHKITPADKTEIGSPHPDVTMGITLNAAYKGFDIAITGYTALGQEVARSWRKFTDGQYENYTTEVYNYWHGEGTSNTYPLLAPGGSGANWQSVSDIYIENGSYFRLQNLTVGYDFAKLIKNCPFPQLRFYFSAQNLFTITGYKGMDPENGMALNSAQPWTTGVDVGNYPQPRTYLFGVNIKF